MEGLLSNDVLYAGEPSYADEVLELTHELVQKATDAAGAAPQGPSDAAKALARANLDIAGAVASVCSPTPEMFGLADALVQRARKELSGKDPVRRRRRCRFQHTSG